MRIDFSRKEIIGPKRTTVMRLMEKTDEHLTFQGFELGMGWTMAIERATGKTSITLTGKEDTFVIFGTCIPHP